MSLRTWEQLCEESLAHFKVFDVRKSVRRSPRTGTELGVFTIRTIDWVHIVAFTDEDELILVRQYRHGSCDFSLEIPGGVIGREDPDPAATAARELREETGFEVGELVSLGSMSPNPALFTNRLHTFLATGCVRAGELMMDEGEDLEVELVPRARAEEMARDGEIDSALVLAGLYRSALRRG